MKSHQDKTLEQLEGEIWPEPSYESHLVKTIHQLRKKSLENYTVEDLRISIGQNCGLEYLIPIAIDVLTKNILAEGNYYEGDLLKNVLDSNMSYWSNHKEEWQMMKDLVTSNSQRLNRDSVDRQIMKSFNRFKEINK